VLAGDRKEPFNLTSVSGMAVLGTAVAVPVVFLVCQAA
jgi:hypothetical protein